jgi:hypothetical protein
MHKRRHPRVRCAVNLYLGNRFCRSNLLLNTLNGVDHDLLYLIQKLEHRAIPASVGDWNPTFVDTFNPHFPLERATLEGL